MPQTNFWKLLKETQVRIPIIQRDYAQGRKTLEVTAVRNNFLADLHNACSNLVPLNLDFIIGEVIEDVFIPFDGQQRLTTLFLLHWYAAASQNILTDSDNKIRNTLKKFRYEARDDARIFCEKLVDNDISEKHPCRAKHGKDDINNSLSEFIIDEPWFRLAWRDDPTISGMLTMLDSIHEHFHELNGLWSKLTEKTCPITFYLEDLRNLSLTSEEMYIKMNARGKLLTTFENFKASFLKKIGKNEKYTNINAGELASKFDNEWINFFWKTFANIDSAISTDGVRIVDKAAIADGTFISFLRYLTEIFTNWRLYESSEKLEDDYYELSDRLYAAIKPHSGAQLLPEGNLTFMVRVLDKFVELFNEGGSAPLTGENNVVDNFIKNNFYVEARLVSSLPIEGKISIHTEYQINPFFDCCLSEEFYVGTSKHSVRDKLILFASLLIIALDIEHDQAVRAMRILRNILENSEEDLWKNYPQQLRDVHNLVINGIESIEEASTFNKDQIIEEKAKFKFRLQNENDTDLLKAMDYLEDHPLLRGRLAVLSQLPHHKEKSPNPTIVVEPTYIFGKDLIMAAHHFFKMAFGTEQIKFLSVMRALLSKGNYAYRFGSERIYLGISDDLKNEHGYYNTHLIFTSLNLHNKPFFPERFRCVQEVLTETKSVSSTKELEDKLNTIVGTWIDQCEHKSQFNWRYYFLKYKSFFQDEHKRGSGLFFWGHSEQSFNQLKLSKEKRAAHSWNPFLWEAVKEANLSDRFGALTHDDEDIGGVHGRSHKSMPLKFKHIKLALWSDEFSWKIWDLDQRGNCALDSKQQHFFNRLRNEFQRINIHGWLRIHGVDSMEEIDHTSSDKTYAFRKYDTEDRIKLIVPIIKYMFDMNKGAK
jgi:hypothetical protein